MKVSLDTPHIAAFFDGATEEAPIEEMKYIVSKNPVSSFLDDISNKITLAALKAQRKNIKIYDSVTMQARFRNFVLNLHAGIANTDDELIKESLLELRSIYTLVSSILDI